MKLLVHNFLTSKFLKGVSTGYPLKVFATQTESAEQTFNAEFVKRMIPKLDWGALKEAASSLSAAENLPESVPAEADWETEDSKFLKTLHHILFEVDVIEGHLECPETGRKFTIKKGIPNMLANEDEVA